eukprot:TRINITY_DN12761_c0_g1_i1.p1 TRINITY_DN12761_c0_g1~~TRINITY_DN12761_c0_g1_i1.p1  ORF type:complete len:109 (+),score=35.67 TRINITY_DN12761_c0_g1_i1:132-458(+)
MIRRPPRSTHCISSAASDVYKRQYQRRVHGIIIGIGQASFDKMQCLDGNQGLVNAKGEKWDRDMVFFPRVQKVVIRLCFFLKTCVAISSLINCTILFTQQGKWNQVQD